MSNALDELQLQRLVDGALSEPERRRLLALLDERPELWRDVALAYVEEQVWSDIIGSEVRRELAVSQQVPSPASTTRTPWSWKFTLAIAASLLVMLAMGFQLGQRSGLPVVGNSATTQQPRDVIAKPSLPPPTIDDATPSHYRLQLVYGEGPSRQLVELPVYDASHVPNDDWTPDARAAEELNRGLYALGYRFDWTTDYLAGDLTDGRQLVVPVRSAALEYYGQ
jgi:hypothetical protein